MFLVVVGTWLPAVFRIQIRRILMFLGLPDPLVRGTDPRIRIRIRTKMPRIGTLVAWHLPCCVHINKVSLVLTTVLFLYISGFHFVLF
jgi:hypothetical protein